MPPSTGGMVCFAVGTRAKQQQQQQKLPSFLICQRQPQMRKTCMQSQKLWRQTNIFVWEKYLPICHSRWELSIISSMATFIWVSWLFIWYFEPSQPQRIVSGLKTNFTLSPNYSAHKSSNLKFSRLYKISPDTNYTQQNIHTHTSDTIFFKRISPFGIAPVKQAHKARIWLMWSQEIKLGYIFHGIASKYQNAACLGPEDQRHQICKLGLQNKNQKCPENRKSASVPGTSSSTMTMAVPMKQGQ